MHALGKFWLKIKANKWTIKAKNLTIKANKWTIKAKNLTIKA
jgi:hypothetical protein